jgi:hypothetical protein
MADQKDWTDYLMEDEAVLVDEMTFSVEHILLYRLARQRRRAESLRKYGSLKPGTPSEADMEWAKKRVDELKGQPEWELREQCVQRGHVWGEQIQLSAGWPRVVCTHCKSSMYAGDLRL